MTSLVLDARVAAKWFLPSAGEAFSREALILLERYSSDDLRFLVPDLFWAELGNIFWKAVRRGRWSEADSLTALRATRGQNFPTFATKLLLEDAFTVASTYERSVYDGLYLALALTTKSQLITADERLANAVAAHLPVKWLGSYV